VGIEAGFAMLFSIVADVRSFLAVFVLVYALIIIFFILSTWIPMSANHGVNLVRRFLFDASDPYLRLFRRIIPPFGAIDLSPMIAILTLYLVASLVDTMLSKL